VIQVAKTPNKRIRVCAVGTAGIGKTLSTAVLIRLLLRKNRTVVYHKRSHVYRSGLVYEFTPVPATDATPFAVKVNVILARDFEYANFESLTQEDVTPVTMLWIEETRSRIVVQIVCSRDDSY
jgi:hypothetical protein